MGGHRRATVERDLIGVDLHRSDSAPPPQEEVQTEAGREHGREQTEGEPREERGHEGGQGKKQGPDEERPSVCCGDQEGAGVHPEKRFHLGFLYSANPLALTEGPSAATFLTDLAEA